jgi:hypothetical protein
MDKRNRQMGKLAAAAAVGLAGFGAAQTADASLIVDIRATAFNGLPLAGTNAPKDVTVVAPGDTVTLSLFGRVAGTNSLNDEGLTSAHGSILSAGALLGNLQGGAVAPFADSGSQNGSVQDLDNDGDLDIGVTPNGGTPATGYFLARASALVTNGNILDANSEEFKIGEFTFTYTGGGAETFVNFARRANAAGGNITTAGVWSVDGAAKNPVNDAFGAGSQAVLIKAVPEPASLALAGLASLGLLARRRNNA